MRTFLLGFIAISLCLILATVANAATYLVNLTADAGDGTCDATCTLRDAILDANGNPGPDKIEFAIPGGPPFSIVVATPIPAISDPVFLDGDSQPGVQVSGSSLVSGVGLQVVAGGDGTEICGLEIDNFPEEGILLLGVEGVKLANNVVRNNFYGIHLVGSGNNDIGVKGSGNLVIDNTEISIALELGSHGNRVTDNDVRGLDQGFIVANRGIVVAFDANDNSVTHNRVHDQGNQGILLAADTDQNEISHNYIENSYREGIELTGEIFSFGSGWSATENIVEHNVLVNNTHLDQVGDIVLFSGAHGNVIKDNHIIGSDDGIGFGIQLQINNNDNQILNNVIVGAVHGLQIWPTVDYLIAAGLDSGASWNVITDNEIRDSISDGINLNTCGSCAGTFSHNRITQNTVTNSGGHGIHMANPDWLGDVTNNRFDENTINKAAGDGMYIGTDVNQNRVTENIFRRIDGNGVTIFGDENQVDENKFHGVSGLDIDDQGTGNITE
jgi:CSLREA domain-containing protein